VAPRWLPRLSRRCSPRVARAAPTQAAHVGMVDHAAQASALRLPSVDRVGALRNRAWPLVLEAQTKRPRWRTPGPLVSVTSPKRIVPHSLAAREGRCNPPRHIGRVDARPHAPPTRAFASGAALPSHQGAWSSRAARTHGRTHFALRDDIVDRLPTPRAARSRRRKGIPQSGGARGRAPTWRTCRDVAMPLQCRPWVGIG